jgi:hypothetical protein
MAMRVAYDVTRRDISSICRVNPISDDDIPLENALASMAAVVGASVKIHVKMRDHGCSFCIATTCVVMYAYAFFVHITTLRMDDPSLCGFMLLAALVAHKTYRVIFWNRIPLLEYFGCKWVTNIAKKFTTVEETDNSTTRWKKLERLVKNSVIDMMDSPRIQNDMFYSACMTGYCAIDLISLMSVYSMGVFCRVFDIRNCSAAIDSNILNINMILAACFALVGFACDVALMAKTKIKMGEFFILSPRLAMELAFCVVLAASYCGMRTLCLFNQDINYNG